jgi:hypothetical protein
MDAPQGASRHPQAVEEVEDNTQESDETERFLPMQHVGRRDSESIRFPTRMVSQKWNVRGKLPA